MQLVDKEDDIAVLLHLVDRRLDALLKIAAVLGAGDHAGQIQRNQALVFQQLRHLALVDFQPLCNGCFADARLADQHRVVLCAAREDLDHALDLRLSADNWVDLALCRHLREIAAKFLKRTAAFLLTRFRARIRRAGLLVDGITLGKRRGKLIHDALRLHAEHLEKTHGKALAVLDDRDQEVLRADVVATELRGRELRHLENPLRARREICRRQRGRRGCADLLAHQLFVGVRRHAELIEHVERDAAALGKQAEQHVLAADVIVAHVLRR